MEEETSTEVGGEVGLEAGLPNVAEPIFVNLLGVAEFY